MSAGDVPPDRAEGSASLVETTEVLHEERRISGPLPPPEALRGYEDVLPGAAERILRMAEVDQTNAQEATRLAIREVAADNGRGQRFGFWIALAALAAACVLGFQGHEVAATTVGGTTVVGLVTVFVTGRRRERS